MPIVAGSCEGRVKASRSFPAAHSCVARARTAVYISPVAETQGPSLSALADRLLALANPTRLRILLALRGGGLSLCQIAAVLAVPASTVSEHLAALRRAGIVAEARRGRFVWYALRRREDAVPWLRLIARQAGDDGVVTADLARASRIRHVPTEVLVASIECDAGILAREPLRASRRRPSPGGPRCP